jgi:hypothetical protein
MSKFIGVKNGRIQVVSDNKFINSDLDVIELPQHLADVPVDKLISEYTVKNNKVFSFNERRDIKDIKIAFVSNYAQECGLSTYFENLYKNLLPYIGNHKVFAEINVHSRNIELVASDNIQYCWKRGESTDILIDSIKEYDPDIIIFNHEFGLFPNARRWLSMMTELSNYKIITTMHSVFPYHFDKTIVEASMRNIIVHSEETKEALLSKGVSGNIYVIPHGCYLDNNKEKLWNFYRSDATFMQVGFGFKYKAFEECIKATSILKKKYSDVFFTALFSESPYALPEHENYFYYLKSLIKELDVVDNVGIIRGFQTEKAIDSFLRMNKVAVFPYKSSGEHLVYGASGAARLAMSKNIPVITSNIPHFRDLPTIKANNVDELSIELDKLFANKNSILEQLNKQNIFIEENSWNITAQRYVDLLEKFNK